MKINLLQDCRANRKLINENGAPPHTKTPPMYIGGVSADYPFQARSSKGIHKKSLDTQEVIDF